MTPVRSEDYLSHVRKQPCWFCGQTEAIVAHHHGRSGGGGGMGLKTTDLHTVPLCNSHHQEWHQKARVDHYTTGETHTEMWRAIAACQGNYLMAKVFSEKGIRDQELLQSSGKLTLSFLAKLREHFPGDRGVERYVQAELARR